MGDKHGEDIGRYYYYVSQFSGAMDMFAYISCSAKRELDASPVSAPPFIISRCTPNSAVMNYGISSRILMRG